MEDWFLEFEANDVVEEAMTEKDWQAVREGQAEIARGEFTTHAELKRELDL